MANVDVRAFGSEPDRILASLYNLSDQSAEWPSSLAISHYLRDEHGVHIHWRTIDSTLAGNREFIGRRKRGGRWEYKLLAAGQKRVAAAPETISFVDPEAALQATLKLHDLLSKLSGLARICDPYLDEATIEHLDACPKSQTIRLLTMNVRDSGRLRRLLAASKSASHDIQIRVVKSRVLHDRYVIDDKSMLILGTSLNGFGKKQSFVIKAGDDIRRIVVAEFDSLWSTSNPWP